MAGNPSFDLFALSDEHNELRDVLRALCEKEIAPYAAEVDETARYTDEAATALAAAGFNAHAHSRGVRRPGRRRGRGLHRDRRGRAGVRVVVADPDLQQARHDGPADARLGGTQEAGAAVDRRGRGHGVLRAVGARGAAATPRRCAPGPREDGGDWVLNGSKCWISNGGKSTWYTVMAVTDPDKGRQRHLGVRGAQGRSRASSSGPRNARWASRARPPPSCTSRTAGSRATASSASPVPGSRPHWPPWTTPARRSARRPSVSRRARWTRRSRTSRSASSSASRSATSRQCSSCSPTWR